jgi:osmotically-inducible protein OsmY
MSNLITIAGDAAAHEIGEQISKALRRHAEREAKHIGVKVRDGTVTLTGTVDSMAERSVQ